MANLLLDPFDMIQGHDFRVGVSSDFLCRLLRNVADEGLRFCNRRLHVQPSLEFVFFLEDSPHLRTAITTRVNWKNGQSYRLEQRNN